MTDKDYFGTGLGIAVRQGNTELQQKFNTALEKVEERWHLRNHLQQMVPEQS